MGLALLLRLAPRLGRHDAGTAAFRPQPVPKCQKASQFQGEEAMPRIVNLRLGRAALLIGLAAGSLAVADPVGLMVTSAHAQASVSVGADFRCCARALWRLAPQPALWRRVGPGQSGTGV